MFITRIEILYCKNYFYLCTTANNNFFQYKELNIERKQNNNQAVSFCEPYFYAVLYRSFFYVTDKSIHYLISEAWKGALEW